MRVATVHIATSSYPHDANPIAGHFVKTFVDQLRSQRVRAILYRPAPPATDPMQDVVDVPAHLCQQSPFFGHGVVDARLNSIHAAAASRFLFELRRSLKKRWQPNDLFIAHWAWPHLWCARGVAPAERTVGVWHSADVHALETHPFTTHLFSRNHRHWLVTQSHLERLSQVGMPINHHVVAPMPLETPRLDAGVKRGGFALSMGRLTTQKNVAAAVHACALARVPLVIAGHGPERGKLEMLAQRLNVDVTFVGIASGDEKWSLLSRARYLLFTSRTLPNGRHEGRPTVVREAQVAGTTVIALEGSHAGPGCIKVRSAAAMAIAMRMPLNQTHQPEAVDVLKVLSKLCYTLDRVRS